jgi:hypothetical protein
VPLRVRASLRGLHRSIVLRRGLARLRRDPRGSDRIWGDLVYGWGNDGFSSQPEYLDAVAAAARAEDGPILECGSGLTTLVLASVRATGERDVWSLEEDPAWFRRVEAALRRFGLAANIRLAPLRSYGEFDWYDVDGLVLPVFSLVVCDGPTGRTRGGRRGLLPVLGGRLAPGCTVLVDDAARPGEREVLSGWEAEGRVRYELRGSDKPYAVAVVF